MHTSKVTVCALLAAACMAPPVFAVSYDAPSHYYNNATGTGTTLKSQLRSIMSNGHDPTTYNDLRNSARYTDTDPSNASRIRLIYDNRSVSNRWDSGRTWNREHLWPQSKQSGDKNRAGKSYGSDKDHALADQHILWPCNPGINSSRSNLSFGGNYGQSYGRKGSYWYTGNQHAGDVARAMFYAGTRYSHLTLGNSSGTNRMGNLSSMIQWHYEDTPDEFELRRNHAVYGGNVDNYAGGTYRNPYAQRNRNAFVDRPEYAWSIYMDQQNDTQLYFGNAAKQDGSSSLNINFGRVIKGANVNTSYAATLNKTGQDGTYYEVKSSSNIESSVSGRYNAFAMNRSGHQQMNLKLNANTNVAGHYAGQVTVDNLDVTKQGGNGRGGNDADDHVNMSLTVLNHAQASFSAHTKLDSLTIDFGKVDQNSNNNQSFDILNYATSQYTANLDLDRVVSAGNTPVFDFDLATFKNLQANDRRTYQVNLDTTATGAFSALYELTFSNEDIPGSANTHVMYLNLTAEVLAIPEPAALALFGIASMLGVIRRRR